MKKPYKNIIKLSRSRKYPREEEALEIAAECFKEVKRLKDCLAYIAAMTSHGSELHWAKNALRGIHLAQGAYPFDAWDRKIGNALGLTEVDINGYKNKKERA